MKLATLAVIALLPTSLALAATEPLVISTPVGVVQCQPVLITWEGGQPPYFLEALPGNRPSAPALVDFGVQTGTNLVWVVNVAAGTSVGLTLRDSTGAIAQSASFTVQASSDASCLPKSC